MAHKSEILFIDPAVSDIETILAELRSRGDALFIAVGAAACGVLRGVGAGALSGAWGRWGRGNAAKRQRRRCAGGVATYAGVLAFTLTGETNVSLTGSLDVANTVNNAIYYI